jgi:hypothetical protein
MDNCLTVTDEVKKMVPVFGIIGGIGAFLILVSDLIYNLFGGNVFGNLLFLPTYLGVFCFPFWWGGIWVIYQGMKPAGFIWSFIPCLLFGYLVSTVNTAGHASYPYVAAFTLLKSSPNLDVVNAVTLVESMTLRYTGPLLSIIQPVLEIVVCIWVMIPILRGRTIFPRWVLFLIPLIPTIMLLLINIVFPGILEAFGPYVGSGCMLVLFAVATGIVVKKME